MRYNILIIEYGMGNIGSVAAALDELGGEYVVSGDPRSVEQADAFILPGVGAFPSAMRNLKKQDLIEPLGKAVIEDRKPFLGICLGMQLLAEDSAELEYCEGLGWLKGHVLPLPTSREHRVPHVGWNGIEVRNGSAILENISPGAHFYFDHGYYFSCEDNVLVSTFDYGRQYSAIVHRDNIYATQFHPEKSQRNGLKLLRNYLNIVQAGMSDRRCAC